MNLNELLGLDLKKAENILENKEMRYIIKETKGYKDVGILKVPRVIKISQKEDITELTITYFSNPLI